MCLEWLHLENQSKSKPKVFVKSQLQIISNLGHSFPAPRSSPNINWACHFHKNHLPRMLRRPLFYPGSQALGPLLILETKHSMLSLFIWPFSSLWPPPWWGQQLFTPVLVPGFDMWILVKLCYMNEGWDDKSISFVSLKWRSLHHTAKMNRLGLFSCSPSS